MDIVVNRRYEMKNISRGKAFTFSVYNSNVDDTYNILITEFEEV